MRWPLAFFCAPGLGGSIGGVPIRQISLQKGYQHAILSQTLATPFIGGFYGMSLHSMSVTKRAVNAVQSPAAQGDHEGAFRLINLIQGGAHFELIPPAQRLRRLRFSKL